MREQSLNDTHERVPRRNPPIVLLYKVKRGMINAVVRKKIGMLDIE